MDLLSLIALIVALIGACITAGVVGCMAAIVEAGRYQDHYERDILRDGKRQFMPFKFSEEDDY